MQLKRTKTINSTATTVYQYSVELSLAVHDYILSAISCLAIIGYIIYLVIKKRKRLRLPDQMMIFLLASLLGALVCFVTITVPAGGDAAGCVLLAAMTQYFFLCSLTWSNAIAISITRSLYVVRLLSQRSPKHIILYVVYAFGVPLVLTITTFGLSRVPYIPGFKSPVYRMEGICFLDELIIFYALFLVPVYILVITNIIIGIIAMFRVSKSGKIGLSQDRDRLTKTIITCFKLSVCLGLGWFLLLIATFYSSLWVVVQVFVELQGLFIVTVNFISWKCFRTVRDYSSRYVGTTTNTVSSSVADTQSRENTIHNHMVNTEIQTVID